MPIKLEEIEPDEISIVGVPATKRKFLFKKADVSSGARTLPNGIITCPHCDHEEALIDFIKSASEECPECGENLIDSDTEIAFKKKEDRMKKLSDIIKAFLEDDDEELTDEELELIEKAEKKIPPDAQKALKGAITLLSKYKAQYPDDIKSAINTLAKFAAYGYGAEKAADEDDEDVKKAGAKLSKDTVSKLKKILALIEKAPEALKLLKEMLPTDAKKSDLENKVDKLLIEIDGLKKGLGDEDEDDEDEDEDVKKKKKKVKKDDEDEDEILEKLENLEKTINKIAKQKGIKKSIAGQDDDEEDEEDTDVKKKGKSWSFSFASPKKSPED
jgi:hypothetical protein